MRPCECVALASLGHRHLRLAVRGVAAGRHQVGAATTSRWRPFGEGASEVEYVLPAVTALVASQTGALDQLAVHHLERVMNLGKNRIEMRIPRSAWFLRDLRFPHT